MNFGKTIVVVAASLGMLASGLSAQADDTPHSASAMPGHAASPPVVITRTPVRPAQPAKDLAPAVQHQPVQPQPPAVDQMLQPPEPEVGHQRRRRGGPDWDALEGCRCENLELFVPKEKAPEAWLLQTGKLPTYTKFVNVRIPIGYRVRCTPVNPPQGCEAYLVVDQDKSAVSWNGGVKNLSILPMKLGCPGKCDGKWHPGESWFTYSGWVVGAWPTAGTLHLRVVGTGCDEVQDVDIWATVTFSGAPSTATSPGAVSGTVSVSYTFSSSHPGA